MNNSFVSTVDCATRKGVTRQAIVAAIQRGALPAEKIGRDYLIKLEDCEAYHPASYQERGKRSAGKPRKPSVKEKS